MKKIGILGKHIFASLSIRNFRLFFLGQGVSLIGTWMQTIAQGLLVLQLSGSGTTLGIVLALQFLPILLFGPFAGVITDRYAKRKILFFTQIAAATLSLIIGCLLAFGVIEIWMLYFSALCFGCIMAIDNPARQVFLTELVGKNAIRNAVSLNVSEINMARIIGPLLAGVVISTNGFVACFLLNAASYLAVLAVLSMINVRELELAEKGEGMTEQLREGLQYVIASPPLRNTLVIVGIVGMLTFEFTVSLPLLAGFTFDSPVNGYVYLTTAMACGALIGGLFSASKRKATQKVLTIFTIIFGVAVLFVAVAPTLTAAIMTMSIVGFFSSNFISQANTILQTEAIPEMRGRVMSLWSVAFLGSTPIGGPIIGLIGEHLGPRWGLAVGGLAAIVAGGIGMMLLRRAKQALQPELVTLPSKSAE